MKVSIDKEAGFCFGVRNSISEAEELLAKGEKVKCLGQIVHNEEELSRLEKLGVEFIDYEEYKSIKNETVLLRAHGEIPETYEIAKTNNIKLIDTTCPIVSSLQKKVHCSLEEIMEKGGQIVIFGKADHPEVEGLSAQANRSAVIINAISEISKIDFSNDIYLFSQTTKNKKSFDEIQEIIRAKARKNNVNLYSDNSICRQVINREESIINLAKTNDVVIFVAGKNSSNGKTLFEVCKSFNEESHYVSSAKTLKKEWFKNAENISVTGSTSSPFWLLKDVKEEILKICI